MNHQRGIEAFHIMNSCKARGIPIGRKQVIRYDVLKNRFRRTEHFKQKWRVVESFSCLFFKKNDEDEFVSDILKMFTFKTLHRSRKGVEPRRGEIGPVAVLNKYSTVK